MDIFWFMNYVFQIYTYLISSPAKLGSYILASKTVSDIESVVSFFLTQSFNTLFSFCLQRFLLTDFENLFKIETTTYECWACFTSCFSSCKNMHYFAKLFYKIRNRLFWNGLGYGISWSGLSNKSPPPEHFWMSTLITDFTIAAVCEIKYWKKSWFFKKSRDMKTILSFQSKLETRRSCGFLGINVILL